VTSDGWWVVRAAKGGSARAIVVPRERLERVERVSGAVSTTNVRRFPPSTNVLLFR
jgi:hypothetical protein